MLFEKKRAKNSDIPKEEDSSPFSIAYRRIYRIMLHRMNGINVFATRFLKKVAVSHSIDQVENLCEKALWIEKGHMRMNGDVHEVCEAYRSI